VKKYEGEFKDSSIEGTAKLILAKGRGVGVGCSLVAFSGKYTRFSEIQKAEAGHYEEQTEDLPF
jgi:replicative DNA helicase